VRRGRPLRDRWTVQTVAWKSCLGCRIAHPIYSAGIHCHSSIKLVNHPFAYCFRNSRHKKENW
jgi:hypothetical protein